MKTSFLMLISVCVALQPFCVQAKSSPYPKRPGLEQPVKKKPSKETDGLVSAKIIGGSPSAVNAWPWMVALLSGFEEDVFAAQFCGGTLIHPYWVLTAAHCLERTSPQEVDVATGAENLTIAPSERLEVAEIILHPDYDPLSLENDLALLRLRTPSSHSNAVPIRLIDRLEREAPGVVAMATGWGSIDGAGTYSEVLREVDLPIVSLEVANAPEAHDGTLTTNMLAAGLAEGGKDACPGDSGGPLVVPDGHGSWIQAGITSFGKGGAACGDPNNYGIYTRVSAYRNFVLRHIWPSYAEFETAWGVIGELEDADLDGLKHWEEFAYHLDPLDPIDPALPAYAFTKTGPGELAFVLGQLYRAPEIDVQVLYTSNLMENPAVLAPAAYTVTRNPLSSSPPLDALSIEAPGLLDTRSFGAFSTTVSPGADFAPGTWFVGLGDEQVQALDPVDTVVSNRYQQLYHLETRVGEPQKVALRSRDFNASLQVIHGGTGEILHFDASGSGGGGDDDLVSFTPAADIPYQVVVRSVETNATGRFSLRSYPPFSTPSLSIHSTESKTGTLDKGDPVDPNYDGTYYRDSFTLNAPIGTEIQFSLTSSAFDAFLYLTDAETGAFLATNDDGIIDSGTLQLDSRLRYLKQSHAPIHVQVSTAVEKQAGAYTLQADALPNQRVGVGSPHSGSLSSGDALDPTYTPEQQLFYYDDVELEGLLPGDDVTITVQNFSNFDSYLFLLDADSLNILTENDDGSQGTGYSEITFRVRENARYIARVSSFDEQETGNYTISITKE